MSITETEPVQTASLTDKQAIADEITTLLEADGALPDGERLTRLALAYYHYEKYDLAASAYEKALQAEPDNVYLKDMLQLSKMNSLAEVHVPVPDVYYFDREKLLSRPVVPAGALPKTHSEALPLSGLQKTERALGNGVGAVSTGFMNVVTKA